MKRILLFFACLAAAGAASPQTPHASELQFRETSWDFGQVRETDGPVSHTFVFTNRGSSPVVIVDVTVSCGCTTPKYAKEPVLPGRSATLEVAYDPANRPGPFSKEVTVHTSGGARDVIRIRGSVIARPRTVEEDFPILVAPGLRINTTRVDFSYIGQGDAKSMTVGYANTSGKPLVLTTAAEPGSRWFSVTSPGTLCAGCRGEITLTYNLGGSTPVWGALGERVTLTVDGKRAETVIQTSAYGVDRFPSSSGDAEAPRARFDRQFHHFGDIGPDDQPSYTFTIANEGGKPLIVRAVQAASEIACTLRPGTEIKPGGTAVFTLSLKTAGRKPGRFSERVTIVLNDPSRPVRDVRVSGNIR